MNETTLELLRVLRDLHRDGALKNVYDIKDAVELWGTDLDQAPPLERAIYEWAEAGYPGAGEKTWEENVHAVSPADTDAAAEWAIDAAIAARQEEDRVLCSSCNYKNRNACSTERVNGAIVTGVCPAGLYEEKG